MNIRGKPVRNARVELWQANANGRYAHPSDSNTKAALERPETLIATLATPPIGADSVLTATWDIVLNIG